ncbi:MAG: gamma-glutamylcyclotransferase family protein [Planctomycetota bacterium]
MSSLIVGYGTLLLSASVGTTIGSSAASEKTYRPVLVPGHRRLFNLRPTHYDSSSKLSTKGNENAAMNVEPAAECRFNAVVFEVQDNELEALDQRERYYERVEVPLLDFSTREDLGTGYCYMSRPDAEWIERDPAKLMPLWRDVVWARTGSLRLSEAFGAEYDATTYMADGKTLVQETYGRFYDDMSDVELP